MAWHSVLSSIHTCPHTSLTRNSSVKTRAGICPWRFRLQRALASNPPCEAKTFGGWPGSKEATSLREKHQGQTDILQKSFSLINHLSDCLGHLEKKLVRRRQGERYHQSCIMPTVKHPETIHVWGCFSTKGVGSLTILPKNTAMNKEWYQHILREQLLPTIN
ncbi:unnamed protein product [Oncorhynchus mykiss]|uniref:Uncharacterized protein n=1 Tax=Oncorhynchus mykiss TaxID=8022 RepID=A0A060WZY7_ONCMY|nr:unnamed protein product [Oncorhynchus mykiss]